MCLPIILLLLFVEQMGVGKEDGGGGGRGGAAREIREKNPKESKAISCCKHLKMADMPRPWVGPALWRPVKAVVQDL